MPGIGIETHGTDSTGDTAVGKVPEVEEKSKTTYREGKRQ